jgi:hypothetical protein
MRRSVALLVHAMIVVVAALALAGCQKDACGRTVVFPGPFDWLQAASGSCPAPAPEEPDPPEPDPEALDSAHECEVDSADSACVQCAKTSCCQVFLECDAQGCAEPDAAETTCLAAHCEECPR